MKFDCNAPATAPTVFSEQLATVLDLFQQWNDCEKAVMLFAVLKKVPFPLTKFLQSVIDTTLQHVQCKEPAKILERNANCAKYINSLSETYKSLKYNETQLMTEYIFISDRSIDNIDKRCDKKEEILRDILKMMPILTIGNDDAKSAYLDFIPMTVSDATRRIVSSTLVQQIFCYVLIHPAFSTDDRRSLVKHLNVLETHISTNESNLFDYRNGASPSSESANQSNSVNFPLAVAPPKQSLETLPPSSPWDSSHHLTCAYDDKKYCQQCSKVIPFKDNGRIVGDILEPGKPPIGFTSLPGLAQHVTSDPEILPRKGRSHSLTTTKQDTPSPNGSFRRDSWPLISGHTFDEPKPVSQSPAGPHVGMSNIMVWLKSLRLHKYTCLFSNQTYEQMLQITEDHLLHVTKGARHKLASNIQKLNERFTVLSQMEMNLLCGQTTVAEVLEELVSMVVTPMKPIQRFDKQDVPSQFLKVLDLVYREMTSKHIVPQDEHYVSQMIFVLDKAVHSEAFVADISLVMKLKEYRHNMQRIKSQFPPKGHFTKGSEPFVRQRKFPNTPNELGGWIIPKMNGLSPMSRPIDQPVVNQSSSDFLFKKPAAPVPRMTKEEHHGSTESFPFFRPRLSSETSSGYDTDPSEKGSVFLNGSREAPRKFPVRINPPIGMGIAIQPIGMGNIHKWLKSLRLHKYTWVFSSVHYEQMFTFTEERLKSMDITQGAARKLAGCIEKLKTRAETLMQTRINLTQCRIFVPEAIQVMDSIVVSPMKPMQMNCDEDVGYQLWNLIGLVAKLLASNSYDNETVNSFTRIVDQASGSEAFVGYVQIIREMKMMLTRLGRRMIR